MIEPRQILIDFLATRPRASRLVRSLTQRRAFQLYGVGAPKTGTKSVAAIFGAYRSAHEARYSRFPALLRARFAGDLPDEVARRWLRQRDARLWLECEAAHPLAWFARPLAQEFPDAKFLLTVRDCHSWLNSVLDQHLNTPRPATNLRDLYYGGHGDPVEEVLAELGEYPLSAYLSYWARHNAEVLDGVPPDRLLVLPTQRLSRSIARIAEFTGADAGLLRAGRTHTHRAPTNHDVLSRIPRASFLAAAEKWCRPVIDRLSGRPELAEYDLVGAPVAV